jgi:hypothetical protein
MSFWRKKISEPYGSFVSRWDFSSTQKCVRVGGGLINVDIADSSGCHRQDLMTCVIKWVLK